MFWLRKFTFLFLKSRITKKKNEILDNLLEYYQKTKASIGQSQKVRIHNVFKKIKEK